MARTLTARPVTPEGPRGYHGDPSRITLTEYDTFLLTTLSNGAVLTGRLNRFPVLKIKGQPPMTIRFLQPLWDAGLVFYKAPYGSAPNEVVLTPQGLQKLQDTQAQAAEMRARPESPGSDAPATAGS